MASALGSLFRNDSWNFPVPGGPLLRTTSSGNYGMAVDAVNGVQRHRLAGEAGELAGEGGVLELHQCHSNPLPLPEGVSVTVDTCQAGLGGKKAATPPSVFTVAADARAGVQPLPNAAERSALFSDVLGQVDFDPGHGGASPRAMSTPTPPLRGGPFHVQHSPGSPGEARGAGLHAAHSMPVMHMPSPRVGAHCAQQVLGHLHSRTVSMPLPFGAEPYGYPTIRTSLPMEAADTALGPRQAGVRKAGARAAGRRRAGLAPAGDSEASGSRAGGASGSDSESEGSGECGTRKRKSRRRCLKKGARMSCRNCGTHHTPQWRCGPEGPRSLCNACGVRYKKGLPLNGWPGTRALAGGIAEGSSPSSSA